MKTINLRPNIPAEVVVNQEEKKLLITSEKKLNAPELMLAVMGVRNSMDDELIGYDIYEWVAKVRG